VGFVLKSKEFLEINPPRLFCLDCGERIAEHPIEYVAERNELGHERVFFVSLKRCRACRKRKGEKTIFDTDTPDTTDTADGSPGHA
jgi:hypothetical protein